MVERRRRLAVAGAHIDVARGVDRGTARRPDGALARGRHLVVDHRAVAVGLDADDPSVIVATIAGEAAERDVDIAVGNSESGALLLIARDHGGRVGVTTELD